MYRGHFRKCLINLAISCLIALQLQNIAWADVPRATAAPVGDETAIPYGWVDFCSRQPQECEQGVLPATDLTLTSATWSLVKKIGSSGFCVGKFRLIS